MSIFYLSGLLYVIFFTAIKLFIRSRPDLCLKIDKTSKSKAAKIRNVVKYINDRILVELVINSAAFLRNDKTHSFGIKHSKMTSKKMLVTHKNEQIDTRISSHGGFTEKDNIKTTTRDERELNTAEALMSIGSVSCSV